MAHSEEPMEAVLENNMRKLVKKVSQIYIDSTDIGHEEVCRTYSEAPICHRIRFLNKNTYENDEKSIYNPSSSSAFERKSFFGIKTDTLPINLSTESCNKIVFTYGNLISFYDYGKKQDELLYGHKNKIVSLSKDSGGKWLVTSDIGCNAMLIIWDVSRRFPVHVIKNFYKKGCFYVQLSPCGRLLLTISEEENSDIKLLSLWTWANKREKPDVSIEINEYEYGKIQKIRFYDDRCNLFMITTLKKVIFLTLQENALQELVENLQNESSKETQSISGSDGPGSFISIHHPKNIQSLTKTGIYNDSSYVRGTSMAVTGTSKGHIVVWSNVDLMNLFNDTPKPLSNEKNFVRIFELDSHPIKLIYNIDRFIVTVNSRGHIVFYDYNLIVAYKLADLGDGLPVSISFNLDPKLKEDPYRPKEKKLDSDKVEKNLKQFRKHSATLKPFTERRRIIKDEVSVPSKIKINDWKKIVNSVYYISNPKRLFFVRDFILTTDKGNIYYVNVNHTILFELKVICLINPNVVDSHPCENLLAVGTRHGVVYLFDYLNALLLNEVDIFAKSTEADAKPERQGDSEKKCITCIKYTLDGHYIGCGTGLGTVVLLDGASLEIIFRAEKSKFPIKKMLFSKLKTAFGFFDTNGEIYIYGTSSEPKLIGKSKPHFMPMTDALFFSWLHAHCLFTIGEDGYLIEYDITESENVGVLKPSNSMYIEEFAKPCHLEVSTSLTTTLMVFNDKNECRFICVQTHEIMCTVKAPSCGPLSVTQYLKLPYSPEEFILFAADNNIGLIKLPFDGNPFRIASHCTGTAKVNSVCVARDRQHAFSISGSEGLIVWKLNLEVVKHIEHLGGYDIEPYLNAVSLTPTGPTIDNIHLMFEAVRENYFRDKVAGPSEKTNLFPVSEVPNFLRALGAFPSNKELDVLWNDCLESKNYDKNVERISFEKCLKHYYNYKSQFSYSEEEMTEAFECACQEYNGCPFDEKPYLSKDDFLSMLENEGFSVEETLTYIKELLHDLLEETKITVKKRTLKQLPEELEYVYEFMPCNINSSYFFKTLLGLSYMKTDDIFKKKEPSGTEDEVMIPPQL